MTIVERAIWRGLMKTDFFFIEGRLSRFSVNRRRDGSHGTVEQKSLRRSAWNLRKRRPSRWRNSFRSKGEALVLLSTVDYHGNAARKLGAAAFPNL